MMIGDQQTRIPVEPRSCPEVGPTLSGACARHQAGASCCLGQASDAGATCPSVFHLGAIPGAFEPLIESFRQTAPLTACCYRGEKAGLDCRAVVLLLLL